jgi:hypothetical protein
MIVTKEKLAMFDDNDIYLDYDSIIRDTDPLYDDEDYSDDLYDYVNEPEFDTDGLID